MGDNLGSRQKFTIRCRVPVSSKPTMVMRCRKGRGSYNRQGIKRRDSREEW